MNDDKAAKIAAFKHLTEHVLPSLAQQRRWPLRLDHCFKRVCLDHAFQDVWYNHLKKPAERHLDGKPLALALTCAQELAAGDVQLLRQRNQESLRWRGESREQKQIPSE